MKFVLTASTCLVALLIPGQTAAGLKSFTGRFVQGSPAAISIENSGIRVTGYHFTRPLRGTSKLFRGNDEPTLELHVRNESDEPKDFSLAIALFDKAGNLVAAATGDPRGKMEPGAEKEMTVTFRHVNRFASSATRLQMTIEIHLE